MEKSIIVHLDRFCFHEIDYMFKRLQSGRPWIFLKHSFSRPPLQSSRKQISKNFQIVKQHPINFEPLP